MQRQSPGCAALEGLYRKHARRRTSRTVARLESRVLHGHEMVPAVRADVVLLSHGRFRRDRWRTAARVGAHRARARFADVAPAPVGAGVPAVVALQLAVRPSHARFAVAARALVLAL